MAKQAKRVKAAPREKEAKASPQLELVKVPQARETGEGASAARPAGETPTPPGRRGATAEQMGARQREISVSEFFSKNRHLLGFDNPSKALLTTIKEAVDNSLDACEEAKIMPEILVEVTELGPDRLKVVVEDNGPGIVKAQVPKVFGKLLYGSKFHRLKQSRGQQGIGISAAAMYGQLTTGKPIHVTSRIGKGRPVHDFEIEIDTRKNAPVVVRDEELAEWHREHGTRVAIELQADYLHGQRFLVRYVEQTALANPHARFELRRPKAEPVVFPASAIEPPKEAVEIKPHPQGVELGALMLMAKESRSRDLRGFLQAELSRVSGKIADEILEKAQLKNGKPALVGADRDLAQKLHKAINEVKIMAPPTNCLSPIGEELIRRGLVTFLSVTQEPGEDEAVEAPKAGPAQGEEKKPEAAQEAPVPEEGEELIKGHKYFITSVTRPPKVYRGNPFQIEVGLAHGGPLPQDKPIELYRFANRVPLLFQRGACGFTEAVVKMDWKNYMLSQPRGSLPVGPVVLFVHMASVWVPFTSESKEALAHYPEIIREVQLGLQECGRKLAAHIRKGQHAAYQLERRSLFQLYIEEIARSMKHLTGADDKRVKKEMMALAERFTAAEEKKDERELLEITKKAEGKKAPAEKKGKG